MGNGQQTTMGCIFGVIAVILGIIAIVYAVQADVAACNLLS